MLKDITLGQYYPSGSVIHRLDPRVKLFGVLFYVIALFIANSVPTFAFMTAVLIALVNTCKVPFSFMIRGLKSILVILIIAGAFNLFLTPGEPIVTIGFLKITELGLRNAVFMVIRMVYLIIGTSILTLTTTPNSLTEGLERSLRFLKVFKVPVHEIAMMMSIALRFIPILMEETDKIMKAQMARGADFESGGLIKRAKSLVPILVPLFVSAFRRANDLALAMEARCYNGGEGRTKMNPLRYSAADIMGYMIIIASLVIVIVLRLVFKHPMFTFS